MRQIAEHISVVRAVRHLEKNVLAIFAGGTGNLLLNECSRCLRAERILMAKNNVDGVYSADPCRRRNAKEI